MLGVCPVAVAAESGEKCGGKEATIVGTDGPDLLMGTVADDVIRGLGGDDLIYGADGKDRICGGAGADVLEGNGGCDQIYGATGNDDIKLEESSLPMESAVCDEDLFSIEFADGGPGSDVVDGSSVNDSLVGGPGNDQLRGLGLHDSLTGQWGDDLLTGGPGSDVIDYTFSPNPVVVDLGDGESSGWGTDQIAGIEVVNGSIYADRLFGNAGSNTLNGGRDGTNDGPWADHGNDLLVGRGGRDGLFGDGGSDVLRGGAGNDFILGDNGSDPRAFDRAFGGPGRDSCALAKKYVSCERRGPF